MFDTPLLEIEDLSVTFGGRRRGAKIRAVDGVSLAVTSGQTVGLVGESGSGKTTIGRAVLGLTPVTSGRISFREEDITALRARARRRLGAHLQIVFQDPNSSLDPRRSVGQAIAEPLEALTQASKGEISSRVREMLERVGLPESMADRSPRQLSGGQRQRVAIARALIVSPELVICDEAVSALDLSIQAQIVNLLRDLQHERSLSYLFIAHNLSVVHYISDWIVVLYRGQVMETGPADGVYRTPAHPYTRRLCASEPGSTFSADYPAEGAVRTSGLDASAESCPFVARCPYAIETCRTSRPRIEQKPDGGIVACHRYEEGI